MMYVFWDYGGSFISGCKVDRIKDNTLLSSTDVNNIIEVLAEKRGEKLNQVGFDACLMFGMEMAQVLSDSTAEGVLLSGVGNNPIVYHGRGRQAARGGLSVFGPVLSSEKVGSHSEAILRLYDKLGLLNDYSSFIETPNSIKQEIGSFTDSMNVTLEEIGGGQAGTYNAGGSNKYRRFRGECIRADRIYRAGAEFPPGGN